MHIWKDCFIIWRTELKKSYLSIAASNILSCINIVLCMFALYIFKCTRRAPRLGNKFKKWFQWVFWSAGNQHWFVGMHGRGWGLYLGCVTKKRSLQRRVRWRGELCFGCDESPEDWSFPLNLNFYPKPDQCKYNADTFPHIWRNHKPRLNRHPLFL